MLGTCPRVIALTAMVAGLPMAVQAADETLTLACKGTAISLTQTDTKPEPISQGIIVNFTARTVVGFGPPAKITTVDELTVSFGHSQNTDVTSSNISGSIDRVTGDVEVQSMLRNKRTGNLDGTGYSLKCRPAQRMF